MMRVGARRFDQVEHTWRGRRAPLCHSAQAICRLGLILVGITLFLSCRPLATVGRIKNNSSGHEDVRPFASGEGGDGRVVRERRGPDHIERAAGGRVRPREAPRPRGCDRHPVRCCLLRLTARRPQRRRHSSRAGGRPSRATGASAFIMPDATNVGGVTR
jgi:hypothetical protein